MDKFKFTKSGMFRSDDGHYYAVTDVDARIAELHGGLRNCLLLAMRKAHRDPSSDWEHIIRFCKEVGCGPSPLRSTD